MLGDPALSQHPAFTLWRFEPNARGGKPLKVPVHWDGVSHHCRANPAPGLTADAAAAFAEMHGCRVGFRPSPEQKLFCIDIDDCIDADGNWSDGALRMTSFFAEAAIEISVSGRGLHIWGSYTGDGPGKRTQCRTPVGDLEIYSDGQFIALGTRVSGSASTDCTFQLNWVLQNYFPAAREVGELTSNDWEEKTDTQKADTVADLRSALAKLGTLDYQGWVSVGVALSSLGDTGLELFLEWSALDPQDNPSFNEHKWSSFFADRTDYRSVFTKAEAVGWTNPKRGRAADPQEVFQLPAKLPTGATVEQSSAPFEAALSGALPATPANVVGALKSAEGNLQVAFDEFKGIISIGTGTHWRPFREEDYMKLRVNLEQRGFKAVPAEIIKSAVKVVASEKSFDSAIEWSKTLVWDGIPRIDNSLSRFFGVEDSPYVQAVGAYLWTALGGRCVEPGCQADMVPILVGGQAAGKTSIISAIAPNDSAFCEIDLSHKDDGLSRLMRGKLVGEIAEMKGLTGRDQDSTKAFITRRVERWIPKYEEFEISYHRRVIMVGSANNKELLDDSSGERRWLPLVCGKTDPAGLRRERDQLWAEGIHRFRQRGEVEWEAAYTLAKEVHSEFKVQDAWSELVDEWLATVPPHAPGAPHNPTPWGRRPFRLSDILTHALFVRPDRQDRITQVRIGKILRNLGYESRVIWLNGNSVRRWIK